MELMTKDQKPAGDPPRFPRRFAVKAVGLAENDFEALVVGIVRRHAPDMGEDAVKSRPSTGGKYLAVTCTIEATSRRQLDAIYGDLSAHECIKWAI